MTTKNQEELFLGALVGCAVGAATALLLTPFSGAELRKKVQHSLGQLNGAKVSKKLTSAATKLKKAVKKPTLAKLKTGLKKTSKKIHKASS